MAPRRRPLDKQCATLRQASHHRLGYTPHRLIWPRRAQRFEHATNVYLNVFKRTFILTVRSLIAQRCVVISPSLWLFVSFTDSCAFAHLFLKHYAERSLAVVLVIAVLCDGYSCAITPLDRKPVVADVGAVKR